jgi:hypothetical protein
MKALMMIFITMFGVNYANAQACVKNSLQIKEYVYDTASDAVATSADVVLSDKSGKSALPQGAVVKAVTAKVISAVVGSTSTLSWGYDGNNDGFSGTAVAEASLTSGSVHTGWRTANSDLWDDSEDSQKYFHVNTAAKGKFVVRVGTNALTAGKVLFIVEYYCPSL